MEQEAQHRVGPQVPGARPGPKGSALTAAGLSVWSDAEPQGLFHNALSKFHLKWRKISFSIPAS